MICVQVCTGSRTLDAAISNLVGTISNCEVYVVNPDDSLNCSQQPDCLTFFYVDFANDIACQKLCALIQRLRSETRGSRVIIIGDNMGAGRESLANQRSVNQLGVHSIMELPLNLQQLRYTVESYSIQMRFLTSQTVAVENPQVRKCEEESDVDSRIRRKIVKVANLDTNVLLTGETGVGKTYWAAEVHKRSTRCKHPFVVVNCANFTPTLAESQLFGHTKGAFTGADHNQKGQFELAGPGTIFLDELDSLPYEVQGRLLRVVEEREFRPLGGTKVIPLNARIISATNNNLEELVSRKMFRSDLFFRMNAYEIHVPPLRERRKEIAAFAKAFAQEFCGKVEQSPVVFSQELLDVLQRYSWPGNLRELRNAIEHGVIDCEDGKIRPVNLPPAVLQGIKAASVQLSQPAVPPPSQTQKNWLAKHDESKIRHLVTGLQRNNHNRSKTAKELGVSRMTIHNLMKKFGLS